MTLRHIVTWKIAAEDPAERARVLAEFAARLRALPSKIDVIQGFEVGENNAGAATNFDISLVATFADEAALATYVAHPEHQPVMAFVRQVTSGRAGVDYDVSTDE